MEEDGKLGLGSKGKVADSSNGGDDGDDDDDEIDPLEAFMASEIMPQVCSNECPNCSSEQV